MKTYTVTLSTEKTVKVKAQDEDDAKNKAEAKVNKRNDKWMANDAWEEEGRQ